MEVPMEVSVNIYFATLPTSNIQRKTGPSILASFLFSSKRKGRTPGGLVRLNPKNIFSPKIFFAPIGGFMEVIHFQLAKRIGFVSSNRTSLKKSY